MTQRQLAKVLKQHQLWLSSKYQKGKRADLSDADLCEADLRGADLRGADLSGADLRGADLSEVYLSGAYLRGADLRKAYLRGGCLSETYLSGADLCEADLRGAYLSKADLNGAYLSKADLSGARLPHFQIVPQVGSFIAYKKLSKGIILEVTIPAKAKRTSSLVGRKCRVSEAKVRRAWDRYGNLLKLNNQKVKAWRSNEYTWTLTKGLVHKPDKYDDDIQVECTNGIHIFLTKEEAKQW